MDPIIRINKNSDFDFEYRLSESYSDCPFRLTFFTIDKEDNFYIVSYDGLEYSSCTPTDHNSIIAHLDKPELYCGCLRIEVEYFVDSASFYDGIYNDIRVEKTNVYIVREQSDVSSVLYEGSPIINFDPTNISNNVEQALNDIEDKRDEIEQALSDLEDAQDRVDDILSDLIDWQERLDDVVIGDVLEDYAKLEDLGPYMTEDEVSDYLDDYYTKDEVDDLLENFENESSLNNYVTKSELSSCGYLTQHQDLSQYATKNDLSSYVSYSYLESKNYLTQHQDLSEYATQNWVHQQDYITFDSLDEYGNITVNLDGYVKYEDIDFASYVTKAQLSSCGYVTENYVDNKINEIEIPEKLWERGEGTYSIQTIGTYSYASGKCSLAEGGRTRSSGGFSHAEGFHSFAIGSPSHSEGNWTAAYGECSHVEGNHTVAYNSHEHAEGQYNKSNNSYFVFGYAGNTLSSIGFGTSEQDRKNAFEVMQNGDIYAYGIGNYDGTNPESAYTLKSTIDTINGRIDTLNTDLDLDNYTTKEYVDRAILEAHLGEEIDLSDYALKTDLPNMEDYVSKNDLNNASYLSSSVLSSCGYVTNDALSNSGYLTSIPSEYITQEELSSNSYITQTQLSACSYVSDSDIEDLEELAQYIIGNGDFMDNQYATKSYVMNAIANAQFGGGDEVDMNYYVSKAELSSCGYLTSHQSLNGYATESYVQSKIDAIPVVDVNSLDLSSYVSKAELSSCGYLTSHQSLDNYATKSYVTSKISSANYATQAYVVNKVNSIKPVTYTYMSIWQGTQTQYDALTNHYAYQLYLIKQAQ